MKSAYGRQPSAPDYELACVEPVSPMGELMRRYWQPVCTSDVKDCNWLQHYENIVDPYPVDAAPVDQRRPVRVRPDADRA